MRLEPKVPDALFFDVDGVLIDSMALKGKAFVEVFRDTTYTEDAILKYHMSHSGVTRSQKIEQLLENLYSCKPTRVDVDHRVKKFTEIIQDLMLSAPTVAGAADELSKWSARCPLHAVSATPRRELQQVLKHKSLSTYFKSIQGWPPEKAPIIQSLIRQHGYRADRCVLIGDSSEDFRASTQAGIGFVLVNLHGTQDALDLSQSIRHLSELENAIFAILSSWRPETNSS